MQKRLGKCSEHSRHGRSKHQAGKAGGFSSTKPAEKTCSFSSIFQATTGPSRKVHSLWPIPKSGSPWWNPECLQRLFSPLNFASKQLILTQLDALVENFPIKWQLSDTSMDWGWMCVCVCVHMCTCDLHVLRVLMPLTLEQGHNCIFNV